MKCASCSREATEKNRVKVGDTFVYFCSPDCVWNYLRQRFEKGEVLAGIVEE